MSQASISWPLTVNECFHVLICISSFSSSVYFSYRLEGRLEKVELLKKMADLFHRKAYTEKSREKWHGLVITSEKRKQVGKYPGKPQDLVLRSMVESKECVFFF